MGNTYMIDKSKYIIDDQKSIIVETFSDDYVTSYAYYQNNDSEEDMVYIGYFDLYNYSASRDYLIYNDEFIGIMSKRNIPYKVDVRALYDIKARVFVEKDHEELLELFNRIFKTGPCERLIHDGVYSNLENTMRIYLEEEEVEKVKIINKV